MASTITTGKSTFSFTMDVNDNTEDRFILRANGEWSPCLCPNVVLGWPTAKTATAWGSLRANSWAAYITTDIKWNATTFTTVTVA